MPHTHQRVRVLCAILEARVANYGGKKLITMMCKEIVQVVEWHLLQGGWQFNDDGVFSPALCFSLLVLVFVPGLEKFSFVLHFVFVLGLVLIPFISICFDFNASWSFFFLISSLFAFNLICFLFTIWFSFYWLMFFHHLQFFILSFRTLIQFSSNFGRYFFHYSFSIIFFVFNLVPH